MLEQIFYILGITFISVSLGFLIFLIIFTMVTIRKVKNYSQSIQQSKFKSLVPAMLVIAPFVAKFMAMKRKS